MALVFLKARSALVAFLVATLLSACAPDVAEFGETTSANRPVIAGALPAQRTGWDQLAELPWPQDGQRYFGPDSFRFVPTLRRPLAGASTHGTFYEIYGNRIYARSEGDTVHANAWIVRVYESNGTKHLSAAILFGEDESGAASLYHIRRAVECNLIEEGEQPVFTDANRLLFPIAPYEIKTFKVWFEEIHS